MSRMADRKIIIGSLKNVIKFNATVEFDGNLAYVTFKNSSSDEYSELRFYKHESKGWMLTACSDDFSDENWESVQNLLKEIQS